MEGLLFLFTLFVVLGIAVWTIKVDNAEIKQPIKVPKAAALGIEVATKSAEPRRGVVVRRPKI
jgi:hypothetical protein